jgi:DNA uptake protein ComE-like DNA-binding protein
MPLRPAPRPATPVPGFLSLRTGTQTLAALGLAAALVAALIPSSARAAEYEAFVDIDDEDDLVELNAAGDISAETFDTLVELLRRGVNLNSARREELFTLPNLSYAEVDALLRYRTEVGFIDDPAMLVKAGVLDADTLKSIAAFIYIVEPGRRYAATSGKIRLRTATSVGDRRVPAAVLDAQVNTLRHLSLGVAGVLLRDRVSDVRYDPVRNALSAEAPRPQVALPKFFAQWDTDQWAILAGTYRAGFGQRLTFDNTRNYTPNGFYRDLTIYPRPVRPRPALPPRVGDAGRGRRRRAAAPADLHALRGPAPVCAAGLRRRPRGSGVACGHSRAALLGLSVWSRHARDLAAGRRVSGAVAGQEGNSAPLGARGRPLTVGRAAASITRPSTPAARRRPA